MHSDRKDQFSSQPTSPADGWGAGGRVAIPSENLIAVLAVPTLLGLAGAIAAYRAWESMGSKSEEIFRGARLPVLSFPTKIPADKTSGS